MSVSVAASPFTQLGFDPNYLPQFEDKLFIEGPLTARRLTNFFVLLLLATVIATFGVLSNSTATVIGAMIVAPLMGPIMATAAAVVMGSPERAIRASALVLVGVLTVIAASFILAYIVPDVTISFTNNAEIISRVNPGVFALITALGAGAAGAFIISRSELADSIGGVAIAISLVPPLCVVGIALQAGQWLAAAGAMLLFLTNLMAILLAGGAMLLLLGVRRASMTEEQLNFRRRGFVLFILGILIISIPLSLTAYRAVVRASQNRQATTEVQDWLQGSAYQVDTVNVDDPAVTVTVEGTGDIKPLTQLANRLRLTLRHRVWVTLRMVPAQVGSSDGP